MRRFTDLLEYSILFALALGVPETRGQSDDPRAITGQFVSSAIGPCEEPFTALTAVNFRKLAPDQRVVMESHHPGVHLRAEVSMDSRTGRLTLHEFTLDYDPKAAGRWSPYRAILGKTALSYTADDVRRISTCHVIGYGESLEFYLRLPEDVGRVMKNGPLLHLTLDGAYLYGYPAYTDVDGDLTKMLYGSLPAWRRFFNGVRTERHLYRQNKDSLNSGSIYLVPAAAQRD
jgi:hypothetical protein